MDVVPLSGAHLEAAARIFCDRFRRARESVPALPARHEEPDGALRLLADLAGRAPGVVAVEGGEVRGYLLGLPIPSFFGNQKGVLVPIYGHGAHGAHGDHGEHGEHGAAGPDRARLYRAMYASLAAKWVDAGYLNHAITVYADDSEAREAFFWNCFGLQVVDAIRPLEPIVAGRTDGVTVRRAVVEDAPALVPLSEGLYRHVASSPILFPLFRLLSAEQWTDWLTKDGNTVWLAWAGGEAIGYIRLEPPTYDVTYVVHDPKTIAISGAYVRPEWRRRGVAEAILGRAVEWASEAGYERMSVDFEAANQLARGFWLRHFSPVCHSLLRKVDERILWGRSDSPAERLW